MKVPGLENGKTISKIVSTTDIYPTLMELCGTPVNHNLSGESLIPLMKKQKGFEWRNTAYSYWNKGFSVRTEEYRMMKYYQKQQAEIELYNHKTDPNETKNIASENPGIVEELVPVLELGNTVVDYKK